MRFSIVGAGALGTIVGAHLLAAGHEVRMLARGARAEHLAAHGLRVRGIVDLATPCSPVTGLDPAVDNDVLIYAVKTYHMEAALAAAAGIQPAAVFSLANGVVKNDQLAQRFGTAPVLGCMANFSGELLDDGDVTFTRNVCLFLGGQAPGLGAIVAALDGAGIVTRASDQIESVEWSKFVGWVALFALSIISRNKTGEFLANPRLAALVARMVREAAALAAARGIALIDQSPMPVLSIASLALGEAIEKVRETGAGFTANAPDHRMSSLQDLEAGRVLEVHETLGYAVREAEQRGLQVPTLALCYEIAAGLNELPR